MSLKTRHKAQLMLDSSNKIKLGEVYLSGLGGLRGEKVTHYAINQSLSVLLQWLYRSRIFHVDPMNDIQHFS